MGEAAVTRRALSRREFMKRSGLAGLAGLGGLALGPHGAGRPESAWAAPSEDRALAMASLRELIQRYARDRQDAFVMVHGVRAMGPDWSLGDGTRAVSHVLTTFVRQRVEGLRQYLYVPLDVEMHQNSFLETFLDAGVGWEQAVRFGNRSYTFRNLFDHARMLFSSSGSDPAGMSAGMEHREADWFAWSLIAFPFGVPPQQDGWRNAFGEEVRVAEIAARGFQMIAEATAPVARAMEQGEPLREKVGIHNLTSGGAHLLAGLISAVQRGYTQGDARRQLARQLDILVYQLRADLQLIDDFYRPRRAHPLAETLELDTRLYFLGHSLANLAVARRAGLFRPTVPQQASLREAEAALYQTVAGLVGKDLDRIRSVDHMLFHRIVADASYAYQGLRLM